MKAPSPYRLTLSVLALLCGAESAQAVLVSFAATYNFANPTATNGAAGQAVHTVSGTWGSFDIIVLDGNGNPGGYFDNNLGIGGTDGVDFGINAGDAPLTFTFGNYTGLLASQTGSPNGQTLLIENIRFGRFGGNANDAGRYADSNGNSFTFSQNGVGFDTSIPNTDRYVFGTPLTNTPAATPPTSSFPAVGATGLNVGEGGSLSIAGLIGNPRFDVEQIVFTIVIPEPSRALLVGLGAGLILLRRRR